VNEECLAQKEPASAMEASAWICLNDFGDFRLLPQPQRGGNNPAVGGGLSEASFSRAEACKSKAPTAPA
jgi:hypothetical protein